MKYGPITLAVEKFLQRLICIHGQYCPTGLGTTDEEYVTVLSREYSKARVYELFKAEWEDFFKATHESLGGNQSLPTTSPHNNNFVGN